MVDISVEFAGIKSPNPFWLASGPPTNSANQVMAAFDLGWGGAVWKTVSEIPTTNLTSRYRTIKIGTQIAGLNNIELISDRPLDDNLKEIKLVKKLYPKNPVIVSLMTSSEKKKWHDLVKKVEDTYCDGLELNFGCPHGMNERGMGSVIGQIPEYTKMVTEFVKELTKLPVIVKLTPNVTDIRYPARAAKKAHADAISLINTINSIFGIDLNTLKPKLSVDGKISHGGYSGPAIKPIALHLVSQVASDDECKGLPLSGMGGISNWQDAVEFMLLGCRSVQVCSAVMCYGFKIVKDMIDGLTNWMKVMGFVKINDFVGKSLAYITNWGDLNLHYKVVAKVNNEKCNGCERCYVSCNDSGYQAIVMERKVAKVIDDLCVGCNLCYIVCPVEGCIDMKEVDTGLPYLSWNQYFKK